MCWLVEVGLQGPGQGVSLGSPSLLEEKDGTLEEIRHERERGLWMRHRGGGGEVWVGRWGCWFLCPTVLTAFPLPSGLLGLKNQDVF